MSLLVQKFGGTSVGSIERIKHVAEKVAKSHSEGHQLVVVLSAMSGETNRLIGLSKSMSDQPHASDLDVVVSTGEQVTIGLLAMALRDLGVDVQPLTGWQIRMLTDASHGKARIEDIEAGAINAIVQRGAVAIVAGFQGVTQEGRITTLGRGGSDTSAVALAAALKADECQIYTDVPGVFTTDPRVEPKARKLDRITFDEMLEMASLGSKVLQIRSVEFAGKYNVRLRVLSTFEEGEGTLITLDDEVEQMEQALISGIAFNRDEAQVTVTGAPNTPGVAAEILGPISDANIDVDMIVQNIGEDQLTDFTFTVHRNDLQSAYEVLQERASSLGARDISTDANIVKVSLVGVGMRSHAGIASTMFRALGAEGINILLISTSEIKISVAINEKYLELAVRSLHEAFGLHQEPVHEKT